MKTLNDTPPAVTTAPSESEFDEGVARIAAARLLAEGHTAGSVREYAARNPKADYMFLAIADAMDGLRAEGFDPAAFAAKLHAGNAPAQSPAEEA